MLKMKKMIVVFLCMALMATIVLTGCGSSNQPASTDSSSATSQGDNKPAANNEKVTLTMMYWDQIQKAAIDEMIAGFQKTNPNVEVKSTIVPWAQYWEKLQTTTVGQNAPDIFWMNVPNFPKYSNSGAILDLQSYIDADKVDVGLYPKDLIARYSKDGHVYCIPEQYDTIGLVYNKELFDKAGEKYPDDTWTWDNLREVAKKLTKSDGSQYGFAVKNGN